MGQNTSTGKTGADAPTPARGDGLGAPVTADGALRHAVPDGATFLTARGAVQVEDIRPGDRIVTRDFGMLAVRAIREWDLRGPAHAVLIPKDALGHQKPERDVILPPDQPVTLRDWRAQLLFSASEARIAAGRLIDGQIIRAVTTPTRAFRSILLDRPATLYMDGMEIVSGAVEPPDHAGSAV